MSSPRPHSRDLAPAQADPEPDPKYACPRTRAPLRGEAGVLRTAAGDLAYPVLRGIPRFLRFEPAEDAPTGAKLERLVRLAREDGWRAALDAVYGGDPGFIRYVTSAGRAAFIDLLPLTPASDVLEIGPGLAQFTPILARRARGVWALEVVAGQAEFAAERCRQEGAGNVRIAAGGDDCRLPYRDSAFDVVVANLVFEWCGERCADEPYAAVQLRFLREIDRVLRPGGALYLATKNRYALRLLTGGRDEHFHFMRFGSALPRPIARLLARWTGRGRGREAGMLYSHAELGNLLRQAGFDGLRSFWAVPEMRYPKHYVPTDAASIRAARRDGIDQGGQRRTRLLMSLVPAPLVRLLTPGLAFLARKRVPGEAPAAGAGPADGAGGASGPP